MKRTNYKPAEHVKVKTISIRFKLEEYEWIKAQTLKEDQTASHLLRQWITPHLFQD